MARTAVLVKFPDDLLARVEGWANEEGMNRMEAIVSLIDRALDESGPAANERGKSLVAPSPKMILRAAEVRVGVKPAINTQGVPLTHRPSFNPQPKKRP